MLLLRLWNYIRGYVMIIVEGFYLEKFMNICIHRQIFLWDIKRLKNDKMLLKISIRGFFLLRPIRKKTNCRIRIQSKKGLPFLLYRYKSRKMFLLGAVVAILLLYILTSFIWVVEIKGNELLETQFLLTRLADMGVMPGKLKFSIDTEKLADEMMLRTKELAWISISMQGTKLKVNIVERKSPPEIVPKDQTCDIVAKRDGVIKNTVVKLGQGKVKPGTMVSKGEILISGTITSESKDIPPYQVHSMGNVYATTWYEGTSPVETLQKERVRTGKVVTRYSMEILTRELKLFWGSLDESRYQKEETKKKLQLGRDMVLPFVWITNKYHEENVIEKKISLEEGKKIAEEKAYQIASENIPKDAEILHFNTTYYENDQGILTADVIIECTEDIGIQIPNGGN